eukprot:TRINITY_DN130_c0_g1_i3.p1 TRINITY_DN130_c0_g1~~TRINITY_DN130_c0_g1_i3.p1  ORF type:complete len:183 (+),score=50.71 TRINITY_DN130_c0_g1_i3:16-564(+)
MRAFCFAIVLLCLSATVECAAVSKSDEFQAGVLDELILKLGDDDDDHDVEELIGQDEHEDEDEGDSDETSMAENEDEDKDEDEDEDQDEDERKESEGETALVQSASKFDFLKMKLKIGLKKYAGMVKKYRSLYRKKWCGVACLHSRWSLGRKIKEMKKTIWLWRLQYRIHLDDKKKKLASMR